MKRSFAILSAAAAVALLTLTPASAQWGGNDYYDNTYNANGYQTNRSFDRNGGHRWNRSWNGYGGNYGGGWNNRNVSGADPSFGNRAGINAARRTGRCVTDLGYGRYEYCGW